MATARIVQKAPGVVFGLDLVVETMAQTGVEEVETLVAEGEWRQDVPAEALVARGTARSLLAAERTALNFLGHLSGVATLTARYVEAVAGTGARILDTRKTTPGLRKLEKAAVAAGGGTNHRMGLFDAFLIKENHIAAAGRHRRRRSTRRARRIPELPIEVEVRQPRRDRLRARHRRRPAPARQHGPADDARRGRAPRRPRAGGGKPTLEASGGVNLETVRADRRVRRRLHLRRRPDPLGPRLDFSLLLERRLSAAFARSLAHETGREGAVLALAGANVASARRVHRGEGPGGFWPPPKVLSLS